MNHWLNSGLFESTLPGLADWSLRAGALLLVAWLMLAFLKKSAAALRHLLWVTAFAAILIMPLLSALLPQWGIIPWFSSTPTTVIPSENLYRTFTDPAVPQRESTLNTVPAVNATEAQTASKPARDFRKALLATGLELTWLVGVMLLLGRFGAGIWRLRSLQKTSRTANPPALALLQKLASECGLAKYPRLLISPRELMPMTWGLFAPKILLPGSCGAWSEKELATVLQHELGHIRRKDWAAKLLAEIVFALLWFHPLVWLGRSRLLLEQERACDQTVVWKGQSPADYAETLVAIATRFSCEKSTCLGAALGWSGKLESRVRLLLSSPTPRPPTRTSAVALSIFCASLILPIAAATKSPREPAIAEKEAQTTGPSIVGTWIGASYSEGVWTFLPDGKYSARFFATAADQDGNWELEGKRLVLDKKSERLLERMEPTALLWSYAFEGKTRQESFRKDLPLPKRAISSTETELVGKWISQHGMFPATLLFKPDGTFESGTAMQGPAFAAGLWTLKRASLELITLSEHEFQLGGRTNKYALLDLTGEKMTLFNRELQGDRHYKRELQSGEPAGFGEIQGQVFEGSKPLAGAQMILEQYEPKNNYRSEATSQADGTFAVKNIPPGKYRVSRLTTWEARTSQGVSPTSTGSHNALVEVIPGRTAFIQIGGVGRPIKGRLVASPDLPKVSYTAGDYRFLTVSEPPSDSGGRHIVLKINEDGTFQASDVPPGEYKLYVTVKPFNGRLDAPDSATFSKSVVVPPGEGEFDLGSITNSNSP